MFIFKVLKGRIQNVKSFEFEVVSKNNAHNKFASRFATISRRNLKVLSGHTLLARSSFLKGDRSDASKSKRLDLVLLSSDDYTIAQKVKKLKLKPTEAHTNICECNRVENNYRKTNFRFLIIANKKSAKVRADRELKKYGSEHLLAHNSFRNETISKQMLYASFIVPWSRVRNFEYLIDDEFDKSIYCDEP